jgi:molybdopterin molybdotransferase
MENQTLTTVDQVFDLIDSCIPAPLESEPVPLDQALHRILREPVRAQEDHPPFDRSSIDGYLVHEDQPTATVRVLSTHGAGNPTPATPLVGSAIRIFTGASVPPRAALIMQEDVQTISDKEVKLLKKPNPSLIRRRGGHFLKGETIVPTFSQLSPGSLCLLASLGVVRPIVSRLPRIAHLVTGAELVDPAQSLAEGQIRDVNSTMIRALLTLCPSDLHFHARIGDTRKEFLLSIKEALNHTPDLILLSGASSVGEQDHSHSTLQELGFRSVVRQVGMRPGKPMILAQRGTTLAFGLPGNPLSHFVCFHLFVRRVLDRLSGRAPAELKLAELPPDVALKIDPRETWWPCRLSSAGTILTAHPLPWRDSSDLSCLSQTHALLRVPAGRKAGSPVEVLPTIPG